MNLNKLETWHAAKKLPWLSEGTGEQSGVKGTGLGRTEGPGIKRQ